MKIEQKLLKKLKDNSINNNKIILSDIYREYTSTDIDELSAKVYYYLSLHHIGTEDVVMINIQRSALVFICLIGIFKSGACGVIVADWANDAYKDFYKKDCNPRLIITDDIMSEILQLSGKEGYVTPDEHDAAFICYTSSSTGEPKGAIHEYGDLNLVARYSEGELAKFDMSIIRYLNTPYLYDIGSIQTFLIYLYSNAFIRIPERDLMQNPEKLIEEANTYRINFTGVMPRYFVNDVFRRMEHLKLLELSYYTVENIYDEKICCCNTYGTSESIIPLTNSFIIDKPYEITPVGKPLELRPLFIVDENDQPVKNGEIGEIVFKNPYFRGYLNKLEQTAQVLKDGLYHSGDIGYFLEDGNLLVLDRKANAISTSNRYIISNLIKIKLKRLLQDRFVHVVTRKHEDIVKIVVFYTGDDINDIDSIYRELNPELPSYMIPTDYIRIDSVPHLTSGKLNLRVLIDIANSLF